MLPFAGVLLWTALKDLYEDMIRRKGDNAENTRTCQRYSTAQNDFEEVQWKDVRVGDIILVNNDTSFPADLIILYATGGHESFISTVNLDGETNLKEKRAPSLAAKFAPEVITESSSMRSSGKARTSRSLMDVETHMKEAVDAAKMALQAGFSLDMAQPEAVLADVRGSMFLGSEQCTVGDVNFLPRGCVLRNTIWVLTVVVYAGDETKTRLNATKSTAKISNMQEYLNWSVIGLLAGLFLTNAYCATMAAVNDDPDSWPKKFLIFCITLYHVVPLSLYVMFEMLKLWLGFLVSTDKQMEDPVTKKLAVARTCDLMEELGQVDFIFSDKTGTLTANEMVFARCFINGQDLGDFRAKSALQDGIINTKDILSKTSHPMHDAVHLFFTCLATCHAVQVEAVEESDPSGKKRQGDLAYSGMSPDEVALVQAAHDVNVVFRKRIKIPGSSTSEVLLTDSSGNDARYFSILHELEFNSDRKRMSVVLRHDDEIWCVTKGADNVMAGLMDQALDQKTQEYLGSFSQQGLRTLILSYKKVNPAEFEAWEAEYLAALNIVDSSRSQKVDEVAAKMETSLTFIGVTAVEDRLQDGVAQSIESVKAAGIRLWVLTGDKVETAVDIAKSCQLFSSSTRIAYAVGAESLEETKQKLLTAKEELKNFQDGGLVLDGRTVRYALEDEDARYLIYDLGLASRSCVCCRLSPMQKRQLVELVKIASPTTITLAIGDGANDVPMIEGAHIGIGIRGKEGTQAVQSSDIAISQFRFLVPLLLCHGRRAYRRVAFFLCFYIYKNVVLVVGDIIWAHQNKWSGKIAYPEYLSMGYNVLFTAWHILVVLGFDVDVPDNVANATPSLYLVGPRRALFNMRIFAEWLLYAFWHGAVAWLLPNLWFGGTRYSEECKNEALGKKALCWNADDSYSIPSEALPYPGQEFWMGSITSFILVVCIVNFRLLLFAQTPFNLASLGSTFLAFLLFVVWLFALGEISLGQETQPETAKLPTEFFKKGEAMACIPIGIGAALSIDILEKFVSWMFFPTELDMARSRVAKGESPPVPATELDVSNAQPYGKLEDQQSTTSTV